MTMIPVKGNSARSILGKRNEIISFFLFLKISTIKRKIICGANKYGRKAKRMSAF